MFVKLQCVYVIILYFKIIPPITPNALLHQCDELEVCKFKFLITKFEKQSKTNLLQSWQWGKNILYRKKSM